MTVVGG